MKLGASAIDQVTNAEVRPSRAEARDFFQAQLLALQDLGLCLGTHAANICAASNR